VSGAHLEVWVEKERTVVPLEGEVVMVGRSSANHIVLADPAVSRRHVAFQRLAAGWSVHDLGSSNGTLVNGELLERERPLYSGDEIVVGDTVIIYRVEGGG
jgi:pSer/pThr/pTyr-binding forkhead associated (FHA) protein